MAERQLRWFILLVLAKGIASAETSASQAVTGSCILQTSRQHLTAIDVHRGEDVGTTEQSKIEARHLLLGFVLVLALGVHILEPIMQWIRVWTWSMRSLGHAPGLPETQRFCKDEVQREFQNWLDVIPCNSDPFIRDVGKFGNKQPLTFAELHKFSQDREVWLSRFGIGLTDRVCTMIPNGPEAAVCFLVFPLRCVYAPLNPAFTVPEIEFEFQDLPCHTVVVMAGEDNIATLQVATELKVQVLEMDPHAETAGLFKLKVHPQSSVRHDVPIPSHAQEQQSTRHDVALVLHTSGTTKKPKIVPLTHENLTVGALCIQTTLQRKQWDTCLNLMPLYHIHGLSVNVLASAMSGSSVVCSPGYKGPGKPLEWLASGMATWYSAVPTMHQGITEAGLASSDFNSSAAGVGLIRNCSAALVPVLAEKMEMLFECVVMPTYAMSESMPIASNPLPPNLRVLRSVGKAAGPGMTLRHEATNLEPKLGEEAEICVSGACVTKGYEMRAHMDQDPNIEAFTPDKWLRTGDKGYIDEHGYLCLSGRYKEIINRGGEKISPFEVENVCRQWPAVFDCIAFSCPHVQLGETVGLAVVLRDGEIMTSRKLGELREFGAAKMSEKWLPQCILFMKDIPKGSTGKPARIGLAKRMKLEALDVEVDNATVVWDASSGTPVPINDSSDAVGRVEVKSIVDSLGKVREVNNDKLEEMALVETLYGFAIPWILFFHFFLDKELKEGLFSSIMAPFRNDGLQLGHHIAFHVKPVTVFLICYGYLEASDRHFTFGGFEREIVLALLTSFIGLLTPLFLTLLEVISGNNAPEGAGTAFQPFQVWFTGGSWFLEFVLIGRMVLVICHKLRIPAWLQIPAALVGSASFNAKDLEPRTTPGELLYLYAVLLTGAYVAPSVAKHVSTKWKTWSRFGRGALRASAAVFVLGSIFGPLGHGFSDASRLPCLHQKLLPPAVCMPICLVQQSLWAGAVAILLAPAVSALQVLGSYALGAYLWGTPAFRFSMQGVSLFGMPVLPSMQKIAEAFSGFNAGQNVGVTLSYVLLLYVVLYFNCLLAGYCFQTFLLTCGGVVGKVVNSLKQLATKSR